MVQRSCEFTSPGDTSEGYGTAAWSGHSTTINLSSRSSSLIAAFNCSTLCFSVITSSFCCPQRLIHCLLHFLPRIADFVDGLDRERLHHESVGDCGPQF